MTNTNIQKSSVDNSPVSAPTPRDRRDSVKSVSVASTADKEQFAHTLDEIHSSASQCDSLTTFNDFAPLPDTSQSPDGKVATGDLVHQGLSGLYTRFREAVGVGVSAPTKPAPAENNGGAREEPVEPAPRDNFYDGSSSTAEYSDLETPTPLASQQPSVSEFSAGPGPGPAPGPPGSRPSHSSQSSRSTGISLLPTVKSQNSSRPSLSKTPTSSVPADPAIAAVTVHRDHNAGPGGLDDAGSQASSRKSFSRSDIQARLPPVETKLHDIKDGRLPRKSKRDDASSIEGSIASSSVSPAKGRAPSVPPIQAHHARTPSNASSLLSPDHIPRRPAVIDRITRSRSPGFSVSRDSSSIDAEPSPINTSAHNSVYHDSFSQESHQEKMRSGDIRIPGTARSHEGASDQMNAQLDRMRKQVLSKEFWMKDDTVKECFLCQTPFTAFRRKHHCRTCGCIFDSKCTTTISGERFGLQGSLRVCKRCLEVISRRFDGSGSDDSGDEQSFMPRFFGTGQPKPPQIHQSRPPKDQELPQGSEGSEDARPVNTPMMAIPATRRVKDSNLRASAILEIETPQLSRPGSSRSLKSLTSGRPTSSTGHKRHHSKHGILGRFRPPPESEAPFRRSVADENAKKPKFPAFHDDNIIDPELADYMSDESSGDEQMSIFATITSSDIPSGSYETEKSNFGPYVNAGRKHRHRAEKSISGMSHISRGGLDDLGGPAALVSYRRPTRRRNLSNVSGVHYLASPRPRSGIFKGPTASSEFLVGLDSPHHSGTQLTRSDSLQQQKMDRIELNKSSLKHVDRLLHQLLEDAEVPNPAAWQKALVPILLRSTDDVTPDVAKGEDMDIRHYVKLKRIPGGKPGDTAYVSGVVFTKNLALKSMPRKIMNPRIVLVTFPIEYQRHQQHFMSLQPVIEQEKEFLRVVVQRITNLRPQLLLAEKGVSGVALQYLSEANISVAYNVKHTVIEAVSRCAETEIISSLDMLALPVQVGRCAAFEVRTFVNNDYPGRKKSYIFLSGCKPDLGCTIALRGATNQLLAKVKHIMEFMVYVVYNLKLESSLLRDESIEPPDDGDNSLSNSFQTISDHIRLSVASVTDGPTVVVNHASGESEPPSQTTMDSSSIGGTDEAGSLHHEHMPERPRLVSLHDTHIHAPTDGQVPDDVPMPTYYSDTVAKYETKLLSASPYVKFTQPYLLMRAREQERRLLYLRRLRDHDIVEEKDEEKSGPQKFQLIKPEMVEKIGQKGPRQMMEILHAVHDAEYDKALFNYQTQTRQWETYIQGNLDLFDPYSHQNIVVLYSVICTDTKIPCTGPGLVAISFYDEQHVDTGMDPDCTLGQYIEDLTYSKDDVCNSIGCERKMIEHHRTYVHDQARITVFVEHVPNPPQRRPGLGDGITMWTYCKICKKDSEEKAMSDATFKYSFGKYLELLYWGRGLRMKNSVDCPHDHHRDHVRYFNLQESRIRIHWDPIDLLEIVVPRARITWKVANDLRLKNEIFTRMEERWVKFMISIKSRLKSIRIDSVLPEKAESCRTRLEQLSKEAQDDQVIMIRRLQETYVQSKYYEVVPFNTIVREMLEKASSWDQTFSEFEAEFLGDTDMRQLTIMQLKKMFTDNESKESLASTEGTTPTDTTMSTVDGDERPSQAFSETDDKMTQPTEYTEPSLEASTTSMKQPEEVIPSEEDEKVSVPADGVIQRIEPLDLATSSPPEGIVTPASVIETPLKSASPPDMEGTEQLPSPESSTTNTQAGTDSLASSQSLSEKVDQLRREQGIRTAHGSVAEGAAIPQDVSKAEQVTRRAGSNVSPPLTRAISQPARTIARSHSSLGLGKPLGMREARTIPTPLDTGKEQEGSIKVDKRLSDRLGLGTLKNRSKITTSSIPRLVSRKKESKVSTLARHFEQLSREFERERIRDRKQRAINFRQPRPMLTKTTTRAIVQVYDNVNEAFEEQGPSGEQVFDREAESKADANPPTMVETPKEPEPDTKTDGTATPVEPPSQPDDALSHTSEPEEPTAADTSQSVQEDEGTESDVEPSVSDDYLPDIKEIADSLEPSTDIPLELPKHQKTSLMKYLTNFWAERSASGWPQLEYPVNPTDHIFVDSDIIVREDEPSSVIALALSSDDYQNKLAIIRREVMQRGGEEPSDTEPKSAPVSDGAEWLGDEAELEKSLLRSTGTHLKYQFKEGQAVMTCKIFYAEQFDALRRKCGVAERIIESLSRCLKWDSKGGKTKSVFLKTLDDRLILKSLSPIETSAFLRFAPGYFGIMAEALFHELPSVIAKMLGFFQVLIKNPVTGTDVKLDLLITENLFYDRVPSRIFDLKGSMRNRKIQSTGEQNEVLLDENMVEFISESPLFAREHSKKLLRASVWNDTLFLARQNVMDYSLMIAVDETRKELVVGIIDCIRTYTWDKKLESWIKDRGFGGGGRNRPTVTSPKEYKSRFREAMARYILQAPNSWHLFNSVQYPHPQGRARFEDPE
jgi:1-phosphatidylinositol-3-phosphate 5-kinase